MEDRETWDGIKADYLAGEMSVREISEKWDVTQNRIYKKATSDGWRKMRDKIRQKTDERYIARAARVRAKELEVISTAASRMAGLLARTVEELEGQTVDKRVGNLKGMSSLARAIYDNTETIMRLYGIQTPAEEAAQKIARQRLALDQRRQRFEEGKQADASGDMDVNLSITVRGAEDGNGITDTAKAAD